MYIDSANILEIKELNSTGILNGVTTYPTILFNEKVSRLNAIKSIQDIVVDNIFVQLIGNSFQELYDDFLSLEKLKFKSITYKVPTNLDGLKLMKIIKKEYKEIKVAATAIYSADQAIAATMIGADYLAPYVNRMENNSIDAMEEIKKIRKFIDMNQLPTVILAASFKTTHQITNSLISGAHTFTAPYSLIVNWINKDLANQAIKIFNEHGNVYV